MVRSIDVNFKSKIAQVIFFDAYSAQQTCLGVGVAL